MTTYGPYYPASVSAVNDGGTPWQDVNNAAGQPDGQKATSTIVGEGGTQLLRFRDFATQVPAGSTVKRVRLRPSPGVPGSLNPSTYQVAAGGALTDTSFDGTDFRAEDDIAPTAAQINDPGFGFDYSVYASHGGTVEVESLALYVDVG